MPISPRGGQAGPTTREPYGKMRFQAYKERVVPRTIRKEQDAKLRELSERSGRSLSEFVREAVGWYA